MQFKNSQVQHLRRLLADRAERAEHHAFVVEGPVATAVAVNAGFVCRAQFVPQGSGAAIAGAGEIVELAHGVLERVGSTQRPQAPITIVEQRVVDVSELLESTRFAVVLDRLGDPGNLGTIMRSSEAAGADLIVLTPGSVDQFNPKVVRSSAGALFHIPVVVAEIDEVAAAGISLIGTSSHDAPGRTIEAYSEADLSGRIGVVMGNEAAGLPSEWDDHRGPIRRWLTIPHRGRSESLNVAMAATVIMFEAARQRDLSGGERQ